MPWANFPIFFGLLFASDWLADRLTLALGLKVNAIWLFPVLLIVLGVAEMAALSCPRCRRYVYMRGSLFINSMWPPRRCSKCGLDLKRFHPFDKRARAAD